MFQESEREINIEPGEMRHTAKGGRQQGLFGSKRPEEGSPQEPPPVA